MQRSLVVSEELEALGEWYHSFESLGLRVRQRAGIYALNQKCKEGTILAYLRLAIEKSKTSSGDAPSVLELFCADGYYAAHARSMGAGRVNGIDWDEWSVRQANAVYGALYGERDRFLVRDVNSFDPDEPYDVVLCCGGLYHVAEPWVVVRNCRRKFSRRFLVVQSVVTLETDDAEYFVAPAPGWQHGSRFSRGWLLKMLAQEGWRVVDAHFNELEANERLCDRGSLYALCEMGRDGQAVDGHGRRQPSGTLHRLR